MTEPRRPVRLPLKHWTKYFVPSFFFSLSRSTSKQFWNIFSYQKKGLASILLSAPPLYTHVTCCYSSSSFMRSPVFLCAPRFPPPPEFRCFQIIFASHIHNIITYNTSDACLTDQGRHGPLPPPPPFPLAPLTPSCGPTPRRGRPAPGHGR